MADNTRKRLGRALTDLHHGGEAVSTTAAATDAVPGTISLEAVIQESAPVCLEDVTTPFDYLFGDLRDAYPAGHLPVEPANEVVAALKALGSAMVDQPPDAAPNSTIPPVYTYWGQFVDHDVTANTDRDTAVSITTDPLTPLEPGFVTSLVRNLREPALNLDSLYGSGLDDPVVPYVGPKLDEGALQVLPDSFGFAHVPGGDLPRRPADGTARIGDSRNDENLIVAQLHRAFIRFHNEVVDWLAINETQVTGDQAIFERARQLTRWHYQAIVVEDFLRTVAKESVVDDLLANPVADSVTRTPPGGTPEVFMPLEHSVAAYRFGHSMVRARYDHNENFGRPQPQAGGGDPDDPDPDAPNRATFAQLFQFTGKDVIQGANATPGKFEFTTLPDNWPIRWRRFSDKSAPFADRFARKIDTHLAPPLTDLGNEGNVRPDGSPETDDRIKRILKRLAVRNLLRGYRLGIPTGQAVAAALGVTPLTVFELTRTPFDNPDGTPNTVGLPNAVGDALIDGDFVDATPLWCYVLREAEVKEKGEKLGEVGSRIVCTTLIGQIQADPGSYLNASGGPWTTAQGVKFAGGEVKSIRTFLEFAKVL